MLWVTAGHCSYCFQMLWGLLVVAVVVVVVIVTAPKGAGAGLQRVVVAAGAMNRCPSHTVSGVVLHATCPGLGN
jgi:hypothetical protein